MSKGNKGFDSGQPSPIEPVTHSKGLAGIMLVFLTVPISTVLTSVFMTVFSFMSMKVEQGETWGDLMSWWWSLMVHSPIYTMVLPFILCICIISILVGLWRNHGSS